MTLPNKMKAWVLEKPHTLRLKRIDVPAPAPDEVLVKIDAGCICNGSDPEIYHGHEAYKTPMVFGHEGSGSIVAIGDKVTDFAVGQKVCWWCAMGAFAEYQAVKPHEVAMFELPKGVTVDESPVMELVIASCRALMNVPPEKYGGRLTIVGLGPSGLVLTQYARALGYTHITGWDLYPERRELGLKLGCDDVIDPAALDRERACGLPQCDVGVVMMGNDLLPGEPTITLLLRTVRNHGLIVSYGHPENGRRFSPYVFQSRDLSMVGPVNDLDVIREKGKFVMQAVEDGRIKITPIITHRIKFDDYHEAFDHLLVKPDDQIKVIMKW